MKAAWKEKTIKLMLFATAPTSIAEDVIYMIEGRIVRHKAEDYKS